MKKLEKYSRFIIKKKKKKLINIRRVLENFDDFPHKKHTMIILLIVKKNTWKNKLKYYPKNYH